MKTRILSLQLLCSFGNGGRDRKENTGFEAKEMQVHFLAFFFNYFCDLEEVSFLPETQFLTHKMGIINIPYHKGN